MSLSGAEGFAALERAVNSLKTNLPVEVDSNIGTWTGMVLGRVKLAASGRPGPRRVTGDYTRTMSFMVERTGSGVTGTVGTNAAQAMRLELGFYGTDSLGRRYRQPPFPHWRPTFEFAEQAISRDLPSMIGMSIGRAFGGLGG